MWTRRQLLTSGLAAAGMAAIPGGVSAAPVAAQGPHAVVVLMLRGGVDGVYSVDPKTRSEVAANVDVPFGPSSIVQAGGLRFGPHWAALSPVATQLSVVRGLQVKTANHESGALQMLRLKTAVSRRAPALLDIIGSQRGDRPLGAVTIGETSSLEFAPAAFGGPTGSSTKTIFDRLDAVAPEDFPLLAQVYGEHLEATTTWSAGPALDRTRDHLAQAQALFARMPDVPPFKVEEWSGSSGAQSIARDLQRTLWLLENGLTRGVYVKVFQDWDSHFDNTPKQASASGRFVPMFARFLTELAKRQGPKGRLSDHTLVVAGSELGRFPILNGVKGKDHFPETAVVLSGPGIRTEGHGIAHGQTGKMMEGLRLSMRTGLPDDLGRHLVLDDLGTTLLHMTGIAPERYGYRGQRMSFLEEA